ncbi:translocation and assembly module lipoprotein TamL [Cerina litoralis]|uniref:translocation and assembly module lipoprotein TamL n=1 Tax=Cerina litoralis TaxID=2874477 RepID=UPI00295A9576|nr:BamA/TamA family outer membrane protein [Cerina litoralis]
MLGFAIVSCNSLKRVEGDRVLVTKNTLYADDKKISDEDIRSLIIQEPNSNILGYPLRLNLYNLAKKDPDSSYREWLARKPKREQRLANLLSQKQVDRLGESFVVSGLSEWLKKIGEAPVILDTSRTRKSLERLKLYYGTKGYFNDNTTYQIDTIAKQKVALAYKISLGEPYIIDSVSKEIASRSIDSLYDLHKTGSFIKEGEQFDLTNFNNERERLTNIYRNNGVYNFQESSVTYDIIRDTTKLADDQKMEVELNIENLRSRGENTITTSEYKIYRFGQVNIYTDYLNNPETDSLQYVKQGDYNIFYHGKLKYRPKAITDAIFLKKDSIYREVDKIRTYRRIANLNNFKYPNIEMVEDSTEAKLITNIYLASRRKFSLGMDTDFTHSNIQYAGIALSPSLQARNVFRGAENLSLAGRLNLGASKDPNIVDNSFFNILEFGVDLNLTIPRIWFPLINSKKIIPYYMLPQTRISIGTDFQKNIGLDKQSLNTIYSFNWSPNDWVKHMVQLLDIQYVRNLNPDRYYYVYNNAYKNLNSIAAPYQNDPSVTDFYEQPIDPNNPQLIIPEGTTGFTNAVLNDDLIPPGSLQYEEVSSIEERRERLTENNLIFATNYSFTKNNKQGLNDNDFYRILVKAEAAGNMLSLLSTIVPFEKNANDNRLVFGVPYSQYFKVEFDYIKHWDLSRSNVLAFRAFGGIAVPYGNANSIPFVRSYFAGGSNDNRGWTAYSLGPGRTDDLNDFNEANLKIALNLEYRFPIMKNFKGALFADAGNIWNIWDNVTNPQAKFVGIKSLGDVGIATGFGIRYDFTYFVLRLDTGFKTYNPALEYSDRWFTDFNFGEAVLNIGINYPF